MNELPQRRDPPALGGKRGISAYPPRDFQRISGIELAIQIGMDQQDRPLRSFAFILSRPVFRCRGGAHLIIPSMPIS